LTYLAPYIRYDDLSYDEVKQALQEFIFNVNVPTRVGFQTPFTNVTMDLICPKTMKDDCVIIGGKRMKETYKEFQREMDMFNTAFAEIMMAGDSKGRIFTFPIPTYNITKDFDWDNPKLEKIWEMTAKYGIPYFSNFINSDMDPSDARSMCCRLRLDNRELKKKSRPLPQANKPVRNHSKKELVSFSVFSTGLDSCSISPPSMVDTSSMVGTGVGVMALIKVPSSGVIFNTKI